MGTTSDRATDFHALREALGLSTMEALSPGHPTQGLGLTSAEPVTVAAF